MRGFFLGNIFKTICIIMGTFVGAGFASGKEIYLFFYQYGIYGFIGLFISSIFIGIIIGKVIDISKKNRITNYNEFIDFLVDNNFIKLILKNIISIFLLTSFCVMVSGFCGFIKQEFNIDIIVSYIFIISICIYIFYRGVELIIEVNNLIIPIIIITIVYFFVYSVVKYNNHLNTEILSCNYNSKFLLYSILYANYNLLSIVPIVISITNIIKNNKSAKIICTVSSLCIVLLSISIFMILNMGNSYVWHLDMPIVAIVGKNSIVYKYIYCMVIGSAIITTALSVGYGYLQKYKGNNKKYYYNMAILIICTIISVRVGFSKLIEILYPVFGFIGIVQCYYIFKKIIACKK